LWGVPYLPGSALKGVASRAAAFYGDGWEEGGKHHKVFFGSLDNMGAVNFEDAWPDPTLQVVRDVMTVHHPDYYSGKIPLPTDFDDPTPLPFLAAQGKFHVVLSCPHANDEEDAKRWLQLGTVFLTEGLCALDFHIGIGAKTKHDYGRFKRV
jgi:CRISPR-associated protein Cmr6